MENTKNRKKRALVVLAVIVAVLLIGFLVVTQIIVPTGQYNQAAALKAEGKDAEAYALFASLGNFKDAEEICNHYDYMDAVAYVEEGYPDTAFYILNNISGSEEAEAKATELLEEYPHFTVLTAAPGDEIVLGAYEQDDDSYNGSEDIEWIVLRNENGVLFAVSKYILDAQVYNTHNGDGSTLKGWLKDDFHDAAFSDIPAGFISKVGLLTEEDMEKYKEIVITKPEWTEYAKEQMPKSLTTKYNSWWLDGDYFHGFALVDVLCPVVHDGTYWNTSSDVKIKNGVRPAIIIDSSPNNIDYYAEDYEDIENAGVTTRTEADVDRQTEEILGIGSDTPSYEPDRSPCTWCSGDGRTHDWVDEGNECYKCDGDGWIEREN